jgi:hypothetical protein
MHKCFATKRRLLVMVQVVLLLVGSSVVLKHVFAQNPNQVTVVGSGLPVFSAGGFGSAASQGATNIVPVVTNGGVHSYLVCGNMFVSANNTGSVTGNLLYNTGSGNVTITNFLPSLSLSAAGNPPSAACALAVANIGNAAIQYSTTYTGPGSYTATFTAVQLN